MYQYYLVTLHVALPIWLVVNTAKYLDGQPIVAINPDPTRIDGILLPFAPEQATSGVVRVLEERAKFHGITMEEVRLNEGDRKSTSLNLSHLGKLYDVFF